VGRKHAGKLADAARMSIGRTTGSVVYEISLKNLIDQYELKKRQIEEQEALMPELLLDVPNADKLLEMKGIGLNTVTVATFVSEVGDINRLQSPKQIIKLAGMNLQEDSSGKHKGKSRLSKRGRRRLRHALFKAMITVLTTNAEFKAIHRKNITGRLIL
jgi:transposase